MSNSQPPPDPYGRQPQDPQPFDLTVLTNGTGTDMSAAETANLLVKVRKDVRVPLAS